MSEKCFCHLNGYAVKDATARSGIEALDQRVEGAEESIRDLYKKAIHTFNSVEEMNAANLADGSIACVPSAGGGGGGLPVVELETLLSNGAVLSEADVAKLVAMNAECFIAKCNFDNGEGNGIPTTLMITSASSFDGIYLYGAANFAGVGELVIFSNAFSEGWGVIIATFQTVQS